MKKHVVQARLEERDKDKFEQIRNLIEFERQSGRHLTPVRFGAFDNKILDSDVIRFLIRNFKFHD